MLSRLLFWAILFIYLDKHLLSPKNWKDCSQCAFVRLGSVLQWLCCLWLKTGQLRLTFVILEAKHWLPFYFFRFICATFMFSLWLVMWNLRYFCCQFFSHCLFLELLHVFNSHILNNSVPAPLLEWVSLLYPFHALIRVISVFSFFLCILSSAQEMLFLKCSVKPQHSTPLKLARRSASVMLAKN